MTKAWKRTSRRLHQIHIWWFLITVISEWVCGLSDWSAGLRPGVNPWQKFVISPALILTFSPRRRNSICAALYLRTVVLRIQRQIFERAGEGFSLSSGERAGARPEGLRADSIFFHSGSWAQFASSGLWNLSMNRYSLRVAPASRGSFGACPEGPSRPKHGVVCPQAISFSFQVHGHNARPKAGGNYP